MWEKKEPVKEIFTRFGCVDGHRRAENSTALTIVDIMHTVFIEPQVAQDAEKRDIQ